MLTTEKVFEITKSNTFPLQILKLNPRKGGLSLWKTKELVGSIKLQKSLFLKTYNASYQMHDLDHKLQYPKNNKSIYETGWQELTYFLNCFLQISKET